MASKTELKTIIKQRDQTIRSLTSLNNQLKNRLKDGWRWRGRLYFDARRTRRRKGCADRVVGGVTGRGCKMRARQARAARGAHPVTRHVARSLARMSLECVGKTGPARHTRNPHRAVGGWAAVASQKRVGVRARRGARRALQVEAARVQRRHVDA